MKLLELLAMTETAKTNQQQADLVKAHAKAKKISQDKQVVQHINKDEKTGQIYVSDWYNGDETLASYNNGKLREGVEMPGDSDLEVGDSVKIIGDVNHNGKTGTIERFGHDKKFAVVKLHSGDMHSFHSSDIEALGEDDEQDEQHTFYVAFYDEDEHTSWIGCVTKEDGGKWHEEAEKGKPDSRWGTSYMSYLTPQQVMQWINKDYSRGMDVEGPFDTVEDAEEHIRHNWGSLSESWKKENPKSQEKTDRDRAGRRVRTPDGEGTVKIERKRPTFSAMVPYVHEITVDLDSGETKTFKSTMVKFFAAKEVKEAAYTDFDDWKQAVLNSYPVQAKKMKFKGRMEGTKDTISAEVPGEDRCYGVWDQDKEKGVVLSEARGDTIEAHGIRGMKCTPWRRTFKNVEALNKWVEANDSVEVYATRDTDLAAQGKLSPVPGVKKVSESGNPIRYHRLYPSVPLDQHSDHPYNKLSDEKLNNQYANQTELADKLDTPGARDKAEIARSIQINRERNKYDEREVFNRKRLDADKIKRQASDVKRLTKLGLVTPKVTESAGVKPNRSPFKIHAKVKIKSGPKDVIGKEGIIAEIRRDVQGIATFTIDYDFDEKTGHYKSIQLKKTDISLIKDKK